MNQIELQALLEKYAAGNCSPEEVILLESWYLSAAKQQQVPAPDAAAMDHYKQSIWNAVQQERKPSRHRHWPLSLSAAAAMLLIASAVYFLNPTKPKPVNLPLASRQQDLQPGSNKAVLILGNGKQISLSDAKLVSYKNGNYANAADETGFHTIKTPNGGQWPALELPDGTRVFLDAASSITFPVSFKNGRKVSITGQAYFQVTHKAEDPFLINVKGLSIEDLGTAFNVNAYDSEATVKTTLVEGSVSVANQGQKLVLVPGQQASAAAGKGEIIAKAVNIDEAIAWKKGLFQFNRTDIREVMNQIARWYNVEIVYRDQIPEVSFTGNLPRNLKASRLLEILSITGLQFNIEGQKIIVSNN